MFRRLVAGLVLAISVGCATTGAIAPERIQAAESAIREAETAGASKLPEATSYLQLARDEVEQGKQLSSSQYGHQAEIMLQRASEDAKLARALTQKASLDADVKEAGERLKTLQ